MPGVVLVEALDRYFLSNRAPLGLALLEAGHRVTVVAAESGGAAAIRALGFDFVPLPASVRGPRTLWGEAQILGHLAWLYARRRPALVHHFTLRPVLYGSLASRLSPQTRVVNSITGLGYVFTEPGRQRTLRGIVSGLYRLALLRGGTIVQNPDDRAFFLEKGWVESARLHLVPGSGVDCTRFAPTPEPPAPVRVVLPGRLLWDKGVAEFVEAADLVRRRLPEVRFVLVGEPDPAHPTSVPEETLQEWCRAGRVEYAGFQADMPRVFAEAHVVALPSYREGFPKALLEACACQRAVIGTDVPGVREVVRADETGLLVPVKNAPALAEAVVRLVDDPPLRARLAHNARQLALRHSSQAIVKAILQVYEAQGFGL